MNLQPLKDKVLVQVTNREEKTDSGIILPESVEQDNRQAVVVAVGSGMVSQNGTVVPLGVEVGDKVILVKHGGTELRENGKMYVMVRASDILAVMEDQEQETLEGG